MAVDTAGGGAAPDYPKNMVFIVPEPWSTPLFRRYYILDPKTDKRLKGFKTVEVAAAAAKMIDKTPLIAECDLVRKGSKDICVNYYTREKYT